jgi:hypothetical protein
MIIQDDIPIPGGILPAGAQVMDTVAWVTVPDAGNELAQLGPDDPEAEPVALAGEVVDEEGVAPLAPVHGPPVVLRLGPAVDTHVKRLSISIIYLMLSFFKRL